jgi:hypothetical protein
VEIVLQPTELVYLLRFHNQQAAAVAERSAHLDAAAIEAAGSDLARRGFLQVSDAGAMVPVREIDELVATCAYADALIYATYADALGSVDERRIYLTSQLTAENALLPTGEHRLTHILKEQLPSRVCEHLRLHGQPAAPGSRRNLKTAVFEQAVATARVGELADVANALREGGLDPEMAREMAQSLLELQSIGAFAWMQASGDGQKQGLGILETTRGLWKLDAIGDNSLELIPADADQLVREVHSQIVSVLATLP